MGPLSRTIRGLALTGLVGGALAACEPPPPRLQLTVTTEQNGADADPGDGVCSSAEAGGACTLQAAIAEGNAAPPGADVTIPAGHYHGFPATITGDLALRAAGPGDVAITDTTVDVVTGGRFAMSGINTSTTIEADLATGLTPLHSHITVTPVRFVDLRVGGSAVVTGSIVGEVDVAVGGQLLLVDSIAGGSVTKNAGTLLAVRSTFLSAASDGEVAPAVDSSVGATSHLVASVLAAPEVTSNLASFVVGLGTCSGPPPTSGSFLFVEVPCGPMDGEGDASGSALIGLHVTWGFAPNGYRQVGSVHHVLLASPLIDAIPIGHPACPSGSLDVYGNPRGVDGDGDGVGGCDIGAVERQP